MRAAPATTTTAPKHEGRTKAEDCPTTVQAAVTQAHGIIAGAGVNVSPSKVSRLARAYITAGSHGSFRAYIIRATRGTARSLPAGPRGHGIEWVDPTGETAARNVDRARRTQAQTAPTTRAEAST